MPPESRDFVPALEAERERRRSLIREGRPFHYWHQRGDAEPPCREYWCTHCVGYYGVPHDYAHDVPYDGVEGGVCRWMYDRPRQCACIDCAVMEQVRKVAV